MKNPLTPAGIEPATFRFVAQHLNHCAIAVQIISIAEVKINIAVNCVLIFKIKISKYFRMSQGSLSLLLSPTV